DVTLLKYNSNSVHIILDLKYCTKVSDNAETTLLIAVVFSLCDLIFVGPMSMASGYKVFILHRHHRRVRHLHAPGQFIGAMPVVRAAKRVVALVALYVLLYGGQTILLSIIMNTRENSPLLVSSHTALGFTFSAVSPFLIISSDRRMRTFWKKDFPSKKSNNKNRHLERRMRQFIVSKFEFEDVSAVAFFTCNAKMLKSRLGKDKVLMKPFNKLYNLHDKWMVCNFMTPPLP
uniref:Vomeronasal type-1 receptor n=1 Tax=Ornithorhynchus anatinus TaxID=9258 RepID=F6XSW8_ORNAN